MKANHAFQTVKRIKMRTVVVGGLITLLFLILLSRLFWVQVVKADFWLDEAKKIWTAQDTIPAERGTISDRNGTLLAMNIPAYSVVVDPKMLDKVGLAAEASQGLAKVLGKPEAEVLQQATYRNDKGELVQYRMLRPQGYQIDKAKADEVLALRKALAESYKKRTGKTLREGSVGIVLEESSKRYYPNNFLAAHVLGYMNKEGQPVTGLEAGFNDLLKGQDGKIVYEKDGNRVQVASGRAEVQPAVNGGKLKLTLDAEIQNFLQDAIQKVYDEYKPESVTAIAADPNTMEILGMGSLPSYDPNDYSKYKVGNFYNHAVSSLYEPGSTFKIVTLASAVQEGVFNPNATYKSGSIKVPGNTVRDIRRGGWGEISYLEGLKRSSNVAFVKLGYEMLGKEKLVDYIENFGFGKRTGVELGNESRGVLNIIYPSDVARATFGQGPVAVTPIQQVTAVAAVANGGKLMKPHIVKSVEDPKTGKVTETKPEVVRQVISAETSRKVGEYLEQVVSDKEIGSGKNAAIAGYRIAGKTGTAQKVVGKGYSSDKYVVSFIGYAPVENPRIVVYVLVDSPNNPMVGGGTVAAPVFKEIVGNSLRYMGVKPSVETAASSGQAALTVPDLKGLGAAEAQAELKKRGLESKLVGKGAKVLQQMPPAGAVLAEKQRVYLLTEEESELALPSLAGLSLRDALQLCSSAGKRCVTEGEGYVVAQSDARLNGEPVVKLTLKPPGEAAAESADGSAADAAADGEKKPKEGSSDTETAGSGPDRSPGG
ncbi:PASTA domain-containing protein [Paenibacillus sp. B01]|nr:PASTA domain-containing protein [Paenibacillus sp. B01]